MATRMKKLTGPYVVRIEVGFNWNTQTVESLDEAREIGKRTISKWRDENLFQLRDGAYRFVDENFSVSKSLKIFNAGEKLVTNEVLSSN